MIYIYIFLALVVIVGFITWLINRRDPNYCLAEAVLGLGLVIPAILTFVFLVTMNIDKGYNVTTQESEYVPIVAIKSSDGTSGSFILGCGSFDKKHRYRFFESHDSVIKAEEISARKAGIKEDATPETAHVEKIYEVKTLTKDSWKYKFILGRKSDKYYKEMVLHVPPGTVVKRFNVE